MNPDPTNTANTIDIDTDTSNLGLPIILKTIVGSIVRHLLTVGAGGLLAKGLIDDKAEHQLVGAIVFLIMLGWSVFLKWKASRQPPKMALTNPGTKGAEGLVPALAVLCLLGVCCGSLQAQVVTNPPPLLESTNVTLSVTPSQSASALAKSFLDNYTNMYFIGYAVVAPSLPKQKVGGGLGLCYPITDYTVLGARFEELGGSLYGMSFTATLQLPIRPFAKWQSFVLAPLAYGGVMLGLSGRTIDGFKIPGQDVSGSATPLYGMGVAIGLYKNASGSFGLDALFCREKRDNMRDPDYLVGLVGHAKF